MTKLGIIAGTGLLPITIAETFHNTVKKEELFVVALQNYANIEDFECSNAVSFNVGNIGKILKYFKTNKVKNLVIAGALKRPNLTDLSVDMQGAMLLTKLLAKKILGDDALLKIIADFIESHGFTITSPLDYIKSSNTVINTEKIPNKQNLQDIEYGIITGRKLGELDIGQSVIIENGLVLGVEAAEGTDALIERCSIYKKTEHTAVLVKMIKPNQDTRLDIPVIGVDTILNAAKAKMAGIAIQKDNVIVLEAKKVIDTANSLGLFVYLF